MARRKCFCLSFDATTLKIHLNIIFISNFSKVQRLLNNILQLLQAENNSANSRSLMAILPLPSFRYILATALFLRPNGINYFHTCYL